MTSYTHGFSGFAVKDVEAARVFYAETLGLDARIGEMGMLDLELPGGAHVLAYPKEDHEPAVFTIINLVVPDLDAAMDELAGKGVTFERYDGMPQDEKGVMRGTEHDMGPDIAWLLDPSGNVIGLMGE